MNDRKLYIEFTRPKSGAALISHAIRAFEGTEYSHVRLTWVNSTGRKVVYEASGTSIKFVGTLAQEDKSIEVVDSFEVDLTREEYRALIDLCMEYAGISYSFTQLIGIAFTYLPGISKNPLADGRKSQVCSELVGGFLIRVKNVQIGADLDVAGPRLINETLSKIDRPDFRKGFIAS